MQVLDLSSNTTLMSLCSSFSCLTQLTDLNLSGPNMLFKDTSNMDAVVHTLPLAAAAPAAVTAHMHTADGLSRPPLRHLDESTANALILESARRAALSEEQQQGVLPQLRSLSSLRRLCLAHNRDMRVLPDSVCSLTQLEYLDGSSCSLRYLNDELWGCVGLRELLLGDNVLAALSEDIRGLQNLEVTIFQSS